MEPITRPVGWKEAGIVFFVTLVAFVVASGLFGGCGSVQEAMTPGSDAAGAAGGQRAAESPGGAAGIGASPGAAGAGGAAAGGAAGALPGTGGGARGGSSGLGNSIGSTGGGPGGMAGSPAKSCGGPGYGAALCSHDSDCLSGKCAGGWCADCTPAGCKAPARCIDNGWTPDPVQDCSGTAEPLCVWGYRCLNCGPFPGAITACVYDRAGTSICVANCADCAALR